jgi:hypothetical protein
LRLPDVVDLENLAAHLLNVVPQLTHRKAVAGERIDVAENIAELVIEADAFQRVGKRAANIIDVLAHLIEQIRELFRVRGIFERYKYRGPTRDGVAFGVVERIDLLDLLLDAVSDLIERVGNRGARPFCADNHRLDRERRVFLSTKLPVGVHAGQNEREHQKHDKRRMAERPLRNVEAAHGFAPPALSLGAASPATSCPSWRL